VNLRDLMRRYPGQIDVGDDPVTEIMTLDNFEYCDVDAEQLLGESDSGGKNDRDTAAVDFIKRLLAERGARGIEAKALFAICAKSGFYETRVRTAIRFIGIEPTGGMGAAIRRCIAIWTDHTRARVHRLRARDRIRRREMMGRRITDSNHPELIGYGLDDSEAECPQCRCKFHRICHLLWKKTPGTLAMLHINLECANCHGRSRIIIQRLAKGVVIGTQPSPKTMGGRS
jgi:hypothetical protein